jgi:hypothetical protein
VEFLEFLSGSEGLAVVKSGRSVTITYTPPEDPGGGDPGEIGIEDVDGLGDALGALGAGLVALGSEIDGKADSGHSHAQLHDAATVSGNGIALSGQQISLDIGTGSTQVAAGNHGHAQLHDAATVSGNGIALSGQQISLDIGTGSTQVAAGNHGHAQLHDAATVSGNGIALSGQQISLDIGTGSTQVAAGNHGHAQLHDAATVSGNGIALSGQQISLDIGTGSTQVAAGNHGHAQLHDAATTGVGLSITGQQLSLDVAGTTTIGGVKRNAGVAGQYVTGFDSDGSALYDDPVSGYRPGRNHLINGDFSVAERLAGTDVPDDSYFIDRWYCLSDGNIMDVSRSNSVADGIDYYLGLSAPGAPAANKKFGMFQIIEAANCTDLLGGAVTLSFKARQNINTPNIKAAIVAWSGTRDVVTSDIISAWGAAGTNPTLIANATYENTPATITLTPAWAKYEITATLDTASTKNIIVMIWQDNPASGGSDQVDITQVQLEAGSASTPFEFPLVGDQLARCQRYYEVARYNEDNIGAHSSFYNGTTYNHHWYYKATKRIKPVVTLATGSWTGGAPTINEGIDSTYLTRVGAFFASGTSGNVCLAADAEL